MIINGYLTWARDCEKGDCVPCVEDGVVGWTSRMVGTMVEPEGGGIANAAGGYNHQMLK